MRQLKKQINKGLRKIAYKLAYSKELEKPSITASDLEGDSRHRPIHPRHLSGQRLCRSSNRTCMDLCGRRDSLYRNLAEQGKTGQAYPDRKPGRCDGRNRQSSPWNTSRRISTCWAWITASLKTGTSISTYLEGATPKDGRFGRYYHCHQYRFGHHPAQGSQEHSHDRRDYRFAARCSQWEVSRRRSWQPSVPALQTS